MLPQRTGDDQALRGGELLQHPPVQVDVRERRIAERDVRADRAGEVGQHIGAHDRRSVGESGQLEVALDRRDGLRVPLHEGGARRAARERLDPERARSGEQIQHVAVGQHRREDAEEGLADPVGRRARPIAGRHDQPAALRDPGDDPHLGERVAAPERLDRDGEPGMLGQLKVGIRGENGDVPDP